MNAEQKRRAREIFADALENNDLEERTAFVAHACGTDEALRQLVEALLKAHDGGGDLPGQTILAPPGPVIEEQPGTVIGRYKLLQKIGEGGFGVVYMGEQKAPVHRKVALKIIKAGMDTKEVIARFEAERQALALMDHPNIAKILDGGVVGDQRSEVGASEGSAFGLGRPYFVMELVKGVPITDYCDRGNLPMAERLQLFMEVCHAVQHAHQKGIIHRDLKPSNILITMIDGKPVPKIIDFGVAKALGQQLTEKTLFTAFEQIVGTPLYMSPEQTAISGVDVDTRSDIYSLGVLLYELLTGSTPIDAETVRQAGLDEVRRMIRETDPPVPSTRLRTLGDKLTEVAQHRHVEPSGLTRQVHGDLDWIVMKALEKDRARRYETANALLADIQRHQDHQPVLAGPPSMTYRAKKYVRRHRMGVALAASVTVALIAGLIASLIAFGEARQERDKAVAAEQQAQEERNRALAAEQQAQEERDRALAAERQAQEGRNRALAAEQQAQEERDRALAAEQQALQEQARVLQAQREQRDLLGFLAARTLEDREIIPLLEKAARIAQARLGPTNEATLWFQQPLGDSYGSVGDWPKALERYQALIEVRPDDDWLWFKARAAALVTGQSDVARELGAGMLTRFGDSGDPWVCSRMALSLLISPDGPSEVERASGLAERGFEDDPSEFSRTGKGIAEFRLGHPVEAEALLEPMRKRADDCLGWLACYFLAMARQNQGEPDAAQQILNETNERFGQFLRRGNVGLEWNGRIMWQDTCHNIIARAEAERLILGREISPSVTTNSLAEAYRQWKGVTELLQEGYSLAMEGNWEESAAPFAEAFRHPAMVWEKEPGGPFGNCLELFMAMAFVKAGDHTTYEQFCRFLLNHPSAPGTPSEPGLAAIDRSIKICCLNWDRLPADLQQRTLELGRFAAANRTSTPYPHWAALSAGVAEYRAGEYARAIDLLRRAEQAQDPFGGQITCRGAAMALRAMALKRLDRESEAQALLENARDLLVGPIQNRSVVNWWDLDIAELVLEEASQLIETP